MANPKHDNCCWPSIDYIMQMTELSERAVQTKLIALEKAGHITHILRSGQSTKYRVHPRSACTPAGRAGQHEMHQSPAKERGMPRKRCGETRKNQNLNRRAVPVGELASKVLADAASILQLDEDRDLAADVGALKDTIASLG
jgi:hypothetical protein